jgi:hypothetical protein
MEPVLVTCFNTCGYWTAIILNGRRGRPVYSTHGGGRNVLDALRNMLKYTSAKVNAYVKHNVEEMDLVERRTLTGIEYNVSSTQLITFHMYTNWSVVSCSREAVKRTVTVIQQWLSTQ